MKKTMTVILTIFSVLSLTGCSNVNSVKDSAKAQEKASRQTQDQVMSRWNKQVSKATKIDTRSYNEAASYISPTDLKQMRQFKKLFIKGTVLNYHKLSEIKFDTYTKATVKVEKVLMGNNKELEGKNITLILHGGLTTVKDFFYNTDNRDHNGVTIHPKPNGELYLHDTDAPLPEIGAQIILPLDVIEYDREDSSEFITAMRINNIKSKTAYVPFDPIFSIWVKNSNAKKYIFNNENWRNITDPNNVLSRTNITNEINENYNK